MKLSDQTQALLSGKYLCKHNLKSRLVLFISTQLLCCRKTRTFYLLRGNIIRRFKLCESFWWNKSWLPMPVSFISQHSSPHVHNVVALVAAWHISFIVHHHPLGEWTRQTSLDSSWWKHHFSSPYLVYWSKWNVNTHKNHILLILFWLLSLYSHAVRLWDFILFDMFRTCIQSTKREIDQKFIRSTWCTGILFLIKMP